jgi:hypothetical protein
MSYFIAVRLAIVVAAIVVAPSIGAQQSAPDSASPLIQDNSFLVEEAYNQEAGVVQHISTFEKQRGSRDWAASFTQEWPVGSIRHQLSYELPLLRTGSKTGIGDVQVNYRYQAFGSGETRLAIAPRASVIFPTGDWKRSMGSGGVGIEASVPISYVVNRALALHTNAGVVVVPSSRNSVGVRAQTVSFAFGQSAIITASPRIQPMLELVYVRGQEVVGPDRTQNFEESVLSPGVRGAFNFASGLQIVPGIAVPIGIGQSNGQRGVFLYLSLEHPFEK